MVLTRFQLASTALMVTENWVPAVAASGVPVLPEAVPAAAVSPGTKSWSLAKAPALMVSCWVASVRVAGLLSWAVMVGPSALVSLYLKLAVLALVAMLTVVMVALSAVLRKVAVPAESELK